MKRLLKNRSGITLVEIIISLVLLSFIIVGMLSYFSASFLNVFRLRNQNVVNFDIQEKFEKQMADIKKNGGNGSTVEKFNYRLGATGPTNSIPVQGTILSYDDNIKKIRLFVSNQKESVLEIPDDFIVDVPDVKPYYYVGDRTPRGIARLKTVGSTNYKTYMNTDWFLSYGAIEDDEFEVAPVGSLSPNLEGVDSKVVFPVMQRDFHKVPHTESGIPITHIMRGKYLTFAARVINSYGRVGEYREFPQRIWIMGIPVTDRLNIHTDVDLAYLDSKNGRTTPIPTDGDKYINNVNIQNYKKGIRYVGKIPVLSTYEANFHQARQLIALSNNQLNFSRLNFNDLTTSILIGNRLQSGPLLTYHLTPELSWRINLTKDGRLEYLLVDNSPFLGEAERKTANTQIQYSKDNSIQVRSSTQSNVLTLEVFVNGIKVDTQRVQLRNGSVQHNISNGVIRMSGDTYINEFAVFDKSLSDDEMEKMAAYFNDKYKAKNDRYK